MVPKPSGGKKAKAAGKGQQQRDNAAPTTKLEFGYRRLHIGAAGYLNKSYARPMARPSYDRWGPFRGTDSPKACQRHESPFQAHRRRYESKGRARGGPFAVHNDDWATPCPIGYIPESELSRPNWTRTSSRRVRTWKPMQQASHRQHSRRSNMHDPDWDLFGRTDRSSRWFA